MLLLGPVETPQDSLPKQVLGSSQGTLGSAEPVEDDVCLWHWQQAPWQAKVSYTKPQPKTHFAHYLATAALAASVGLVLDITWPNVRPGPLQRNALIG